MTPILWVALLLIGLGSEGQFFLSPDTQFEVGAREHRPPPCRPATRAELVREGLAPVGKASTFNLRGFYVCESTIIRYGDRDTYADFVANHAAAKAKAVVRRLSEERRAHPERFKKPWSVRVEIADAATRDDGDPEVAKLRSHVEKVYWTEMTEALGPGSVTRRKDPAATALVVAVRRVAEADLLFGVYVAEGGTAGDGADATTADDGIVESEGARWRKL